MGNAVFPSLPGINWGRTRTPIWKTLIKESASGKEVRTALMTTPRWRYSCSFEVLDERAGAGQLQALVGLFNACRGSWDSFLYDDPRDNEAVLEQFGSGDGETNVFQLVRSFGNFVEPIAAVNGPVQIYRAGVLQVAPTNYSISLSGRVTWVVPPAPGEALSWSGKFYWRCRFLRDETEFAEFLYGLWEARKVEFITLKGES